MGKSLIMWANKQKRMRKLHKLKWWQGKIMWSVVGCSTQKRSSDPVKPDKLLGVSQDRTCMAHCWYNLGALEAGLLAPCVRDCKCSNVWVGDPYLSITDSSDFEIPGWKIPRASPSSWAFPSLLDAVISFTVLVLPYFDWLSLCDFCKACLLLFPSRVFFIMSN